MRNLFCTADRIGTETGGGVVTWNEFQALKEYALAAKEETLLFDASTMDVSRLGLPNSPYVQDYVADSMVLNHLSAGRFKLAHFYSGMFSKTIWRLKHDGAKITQTIAAHDMVLSAEEFAKYGMAYDFPHLTNHVLFPTYIEGQLMADKVICPSTQSAEIVKRYGVRDPIVIPHGVNLPADSAPLPEKFTVGYLGQSGPDKGLIYLLEAWSKLNLPDCKLLMAGRGIEQMAPVWQAVGGRGEVQFLGWVKNISDFYHSISCYVQPSVTEGFGIEVLEAMAHGRPVIVSDGAGASNVVTHGYDGFVFPKRDVEALCTHLLQLKEKPINYMEPMKAVVRNTASKYTWDKIIPQYQALWTELTKEEEVEDDDCFACHGSRICQMCRARTNKCEECGGTGVCQECREEKE